MISETKLDDSFPSAQFLLDWFSKPYRLHRCSNGGGIFLYIRDDIPARLLPNSNKTEIIFAEINFRKKKWLICAIYNPPKTNISNHFHYLGKGPDNYIGNYDDILSGDSKSCLSDFYYIYNLKNLVKEPICFKNPDNPSCIDLFLTNRPRTDLHQLVIAVLKTFYKKLRPKMIHYRNYKNFHCVKSVQKQSFFWSVFSRTRAEYGDLLTSVNLRIKPEYRENTDQRKLRIWTLFTQFLRKNN